LQIKGRVQCQANASKQSGGVTGVRVDVERRITKHPLG
jgi:hypothetical protein